MNDNAPALPKRHKTPAKKYPLCSFKKAIKLIEKKCGNVYISERHGKGYNKVIILPEAMMEFECMISYGRRSPMNEKELKYIGYGHIMIDENGYFTHIVSHFIQIHTTNRTTVSASNLGKNGEFNPGLDFLEYYIEEYKNAESRFNTDAYGYCVDPFLEICGSSEYVLEGHTHPNLGVFFSSTDITSGASRAASTPICIFVCDPIKKLMLGCIGKNFSKAEVIVYSRKNGAAPEDDHYDPRLITPTDKIMKLAINALQTEVFDGKIHIHSRRDNRTCLDIKLVIPPADEPVFDMEDSADDYDT